jgi:hypothetical protein
MVLSQLLDLPLTDAVDATVSYMTYTGEVFLGIEEDSGNRRAHTRQLGLLAALFA